MPHAFAPLGAPSGCPHTLRVWVHLALFTIGSVKLIITALGSVWNLKAIKEKYLNLILMDNIDRK